MGQAIHFIKQTKNQKKNAVFFSEIMEINNDGTHIKRDRKQKDF